MALASSRYDPDSGQFPTRLLAIGYATGAIAALAVHLQSGGLIAVILTFWLGGAVATLAWGGVLLLFLQLNADRANPAVSRGAGANSATQKRPQRHPVMLREQSGVAPTPAPLRQ